MGLQFILHKWMLLLVKQMNVSMFDLKKTILEVPLIKVDGIVVLGRASLFHLLQSLNYLNGIFPLLFLQKLVAIW